MAAGLECGRVSFIPVLELEHGGKHGGPDLWPGGARDGVAGLCAAGTCRAL